MRILFLLCIPVLLIGCSSPKPPPPPLIRQEYPTPARPFVYDVKRPGYLICGGRDGKQDIPLKLPSDHSALKFNFGAGLLLVLCAKDNSLFKRSAYIFDATARCLAFSVLERQPVYGENRYRLWLANRPEALVFLAEGFKQDSDPAFRGKDPEAYYLRPERKAVRLGVPRLIDACFDPEAGYCILHRNKQGSIELRYYTHGKRVWSRKIKSADKFKVPKLAPTRKPGIVAILIVDGERRYYTDRGDVLKDGS